MFYLNWFVTALILSTSQPSFSHEVQENGEFLKALTLCPSPHNPMDGLSRLQGNLFYKVEELNSDKGVHEFLVTVVHSAHARNLSILAPDIVKGQFNLKTWYQTTPLGSDRLYQCQLTVQVKDN